MKAKYTLERYLNSLLHGDRNACRSVIEETLQSGIPANSVYMDVIWPVMVEIDTLYRTNRIDSAQEAFATRINRTIVDQLQNKLPRKPLRARKIVVSCANTQNAELGAQMVTDLFESDGWEVRFLGGTVNNDDIIAFIHEYRPDILLLYGLQANEAPRTRHLIDNIKSINAWPEMKIMLSGGVFARAEALWEEIGADLYANTAAEAVRIASAEPDDLTKPIRTIKRRKKNITETETNTTEQTVTT